MMAQNFWGKFMEILAKAWTFTVYNFRIRISDIPVSRGKN